MIEFSLVGWIAVGVLTVLGLLVVECMNEGNVVIDRDDVLFSLLCIVLWPFAWVMIVIHLIRETGKQEFFR